MESPRSQSSKTSCSEPDVAADKSTRFKRLTSVSKAQASKSVRFSSPPEEVSKKSPRILRLTLKMPSGKMREPAGGRPARRTVNVFQENPIVEGPRASRNKKKIVEVPTSEEDDDEDLEDEEEDEVDDEDAPGEDDEDADADGDIDMDEIPPQSAVKRSFKPAVSRGKGAKSVEEKEMDMEEDEDDDEDLDDDDDDELLSDTDLDAEGEPDDLDESAVPDANAEGLDEEDEEDDLDEDMDSDVMGTNLGKTTKRQRGNLGNDFLQLPMGE